MLECKLSVLRMKLILVSRILQDSIMTGMKGKNGGAYKKERLTKVRIREHVGE